MRVALDIGGSKTKMTVYDGAIAKTFSVKGSFGLAADRSEILSDLKNGIEEIMKAYPAKAERALVNLGGKNTGQIILTLRAALGDIPVEVYRESSGYIAEKMMELYDCNIVVMAGTGCIAFGANEDTKCIIGGWGKEIGDTGCGYSLGMSAIQETLVELDSSEESLSEIAKIISGREAPFDFTDFDGYTEARDEVRSRLPKSREDVAALTRQVVDCAHKGCCTSRRLCEQVGEEIGRTVTAMARKIGVRNVRVVINGGMTAFYDLWSDRAKQVIKKEITLEEMIVTNDGIQNALNFIMEDKSL